MSFLMENITRFQSLNLSFSYFFLPSTYRKERKKKRWPLDRKCFSGRGSKNRVQTGKPTLALGQCEPASSIMAMVGTVADNTQKTLSISFTYTSSFNPQNNPAFWYFNYRCFTNTIAGRVGMHALPTGLSTASLTQHTTQQETGKT